MNDGRMMDYAVVGGGISGIYAAWRLASSFPAGGEGVHVFEMSDRIGGRLETVRLAGMPHVPVELGDLRILKTQDVVCKLIDRLALPTVDCSTDGRDDRAYFRGRHFEARDYADPSLVPYDLRDEEEGLSPSELIAKAIESVVPGAGRLPPHALRAACEKAVLNGVPLRQLGFWQVLGSALSVEAYHLVMAGCGIEGMLANWNAAEAVCWFMADRSTDPSAASHLRLKDGCDALPLALWDRLVENGGRVHLRQELLAFRRRPDGCYDLTFEDHKSGQRRELAARHLILAMPKRSLQRLAERTLDQRGASPFFEMPGVAELIGSVEGHALYRLALAYPEPWWHEAGSTSGDVLTDLPLRHVRYSGAAGEPLEGGASNRTSLVTASYADNAAAGFWNGIRASGPCFAGAPNPFAASHRALHAQDHAVSALMVEEATRQLATLHGRDDLPRAHDAAFRDWGDDPYGGGWHSWAVGVNGAEVARRMVRPVPGENVFVCGEAYSTRQGWVEGALQTAETMLVEHLGLAPLLQPMALAS